MEPTFTVTAIDRETGERVTCPITAPGVEQAMIVGDELPDPYDEREDDDDD